ncbi:MAG: DUF4175 domain-containing protein [Bacteroidia bacterium]|nr:DUF4175 domain-containing protein [Bacteroidia bacterium]
MNQKDNYTILIEKLDNFIRKYYINNILRGTLYTVGLIIFLFILFSVLEHFFYFGKGGRKILFWSFIATSVASLGWLIIKPILQYFKLGNIISHEQAANIIGRHFENVKDRLLNVLQLKHQMDQESTTDLLFASINQKSESIRLVPFKSAIDLRKNQKYLKYALPPILALLVLLFAAPSVITDSSNRILKNNQDFEKEAPFQFIIDSEELEVVQFDDYPLQVKIDGDVLPDEAYILVDNYQYRLQKEDASTFSYVFSNVNKDTDFKVFSGDVSSVTQKLSVIEKPNIVGFDIKMNFPKYIARPSETLSSIGDVIIPQGTVLNWTFDSKNTNELALKFASLQNRVIAKSLQDDFYSYTKRVMKDDRYKIFVSNERLPNADSISYMISVIPDLHPSISVERFVDSLDSKLNYFIGEASDDYGLLNLSFNYSIVNENGTGEELVSIKLPKPSDRAIQYDYTLDVNELDLQPGDKLTYYFEAFDNDGINGSKSSKTSMMAFEKPTIEEYEAQAEANNEDIKKDLKEALKESKKIQEDLKKLKDKLVQEQEMKWQDKKELEKLMERQKELEKKMQEAKDKFDENVKNQEEFEQPSEEILEKQQRLQEMFEEIQNPEVKELMEKIAELLQELEKDVSLEMMEEMQFSDEEMEMQLDRMLEMFKQLEVEKEMKDQIDKLQELAEKQEELAKETETEEKPQEELIKEQEEINEEFNDVQEKMEEIEKKNEELERPKQLGQDEEKMEDIEQDLNNSKEQMEQNQNSKSAKSQKKAAQKMKEMAQAMSMEMQSGEMEQMAEDMQALRQLLENLIGLSFDQEMLIDDIAIADINTPNYVNLVRHQYKLQDDFKLVQDSLHALSKRVSQIETFITEKVTDVKENMKESIDNLEERKKPEAGDNQQRTMKNVNDLALMLNEAMEQMQQQMSSMMAGSQMCSKPGNTPKDGNAPMDKISQGQQQLNKEMEEYKEGLENGKDGKEGSSEKFAKMAAKQAALRKALREIQEEKRGQGQGDKELQELIDQMNKTEIDLVNKRLQNETMKRQQEILTRLLESERAEREKEQDQKRKAESATQKERKLPPSLEEYLKKKASEIEQFNKVSPALKPYYKNLVEEYFKKLKKAG